MQHIALRIEGMTCSACQAHVERAARSVAGVSNAAVNLLSGTMSVDLQNGIDEARASAQIIEAVHAAGYTAAPFDYSDDNPSHAPTPAEHARTEALALRRRLAWSIVLWVPLVVVGMGTMHHSSMGTAVAQIALLTPIVLLNHTYFTRGLRALLHGAPTMDSLVGIGSAASIAWSIAGAAQLAANPSASPTLYFESAGTILTLVTVGKFLEARAKVQTGGALEKLINLAPATATILVEHDERTVPVASVQPGDLVRVKPGASIPVDGIVRTGSSAVDQSALTGEPVPAEVGPGSTVHAGTVNTTGTFTLCATRVGGQTTLAQIVQLVQDANATKAPIARMADKVSAVFVPAVLLISLVTFIGWMVASNGNIDQALTSAVAVLVISCPCAMGLATPVAIMVATGRGAELGVLFKRADALEALSQISTVAFDKTGTLTQGAPEVTAIQPVTRDGKPLMSTRALLKLAYALEAPSEHPLAHAVTQRAQAEGFAARPVEDFRAVPGRGVEAREGRNRIAAGNEAFMRDLGVELASKIAKDHDGQTPLHVARNGTHVGTIWVSDRIRPTSPKAVAALEGLGVATTMITGDNRPSATAIAQACGIESVVSNVLPADKERVVRELENEQDGVAMVGDGINDAPALARAHVGIAMGNGAEVAREGASVVLMRADPLDVARAIELARATVRIIKQNLFWALAYNAFGIPLAAGLFYPVLGWQLSPMFGAAAMSFSSIFVCANALRLRHFTPRS